MPPQLNGIVAKQNPAVVVYVKEKQREQAVEVQPLIHNRYISIA
jgi:hypothetical protein